MGKILLIEDYTLVMDKAADIIYYHMTGSRRLDSYIKPRRSALDLPLKSISKKKALAKKRKQENDKVFRDLGIVPGKKQKKDGGGNGRGGSSQYTD
jgi:hypothetical protein